MKVHELALKGTGGKRELARTGTEQFSLLGVSWTGATKRVDGTVFSAGTGNGGSWNVHLTGGATQYGKLTTAAGSVAYTDAATGDFNATSA